MGLWLEFSAIHVNNVVFQLDLDQLRGEDLSHLRISHTLLPVIKTERTFFQRKREGMFLKAAKAYKSRFGISPEAFYSIDR